MSTRPIAALVAVLLGTFLLVTDVPATAQGAAAQGAPAQGASALRDRTASPSDRAFAQGFRDGDADGWRIGLDDGTRCRRYYERTPRLGRQGRHYRAGYRAAYTPAYRQGYTAARYGDRTCRAPGRYR